jgi:hypothetical protein
VVSDEPKIPLVRKRHSETLIVTIRYFYTFLLILNEFSVREHRADVRRIRGPYTHRGCDRRCTQHRDSGCPEHPRRLGETAASCHQVIDENNRTGRDRPAEPESA